MAYFVSQQQGLLRNEELKRQLRERLPEYMIPARFVELARMPLTTQGKVDRLNLPVPVFERSELGGEFVAPRDSLELQLANIWSDILHVSPVGVRDNFFELGGHSLMAVRLMNRIREQFGYELQLSSIFQGANIESLSQLLREQTVARPASPLVAIQPKGSKPGFFCVHPAGGQVLCYYHLAQRLGTERPFYGLEAPGFIEIAESEDNYRRIEERAAAYIEAIRAVQPAGPYLLGGWSFGGIVAFEMAQQLRKQGQQVALLALLDTIAPVFSAEFDDDAGLLTSIVTEAAVQAGKPLRLSPEDLQGIALAEQLELTIERVTEAGLLPADVKPETALEWLRRILQGTKTRSRSVLDYVPESYPGRITLFSAETSSDYLVNPALREIAQLYSDPAHGWSALSTEGVEIVSIPGYHATLLLEPQVQTLAERLEECIRRAEQEEQL